MKKYWIGAIAVVFALGMVAFTNPPKKQKPPTTFVFQFDIANFTPTLDHVQDPSCWLLVPDSTGCSPLANEKACKIEVAEASTEIVDDQRQLKESALIVANHASTGTIFFAEEGGSVLEAYNRPY